MSFEKETATAATVSSQRTGVWVKDTVDIVARILSEMEFFEGLRRWREWPAQLEWR